MLDAGADAGLLDAGADVSLLDAAADAGLLDAVIDVGLLDAGADAICRSDVGTDAGLSVRSWYRRTSVILSEDSMMVKCVQL